MRICLIPLFLFIATTTTTPSPTLLIGDNFDTIETRTGFGSCLEENTDFNGNDITPLTVRFTNSWQECDALCNQFTQCNYWTYKKNHICWLKTSDAGRAYQNGVFSGPKGCSLECPTGLNYRSIDGSCYYIQTVLQASFETAQTDCDTRFPNGGHLFEPQSLNFDEKVMDATLEVYSGPRQYYIGVKRETVGSDFKLVSSGITVPFEINWYTPSYPISAASWRCGVVRSSHNGGSSGSSGFRWLNSPCNKEWYSICESATTTTTITYPTTTTTTTITTTTTTTTPAEITTTTPPPTPPPTTCEDIKSTKFCEKAKKKGKCSKSSIWKKCPSTCEKCDVEEPCEDQKSSKFCKKALKKGKCGKSSILKKCKKTCDKC